MKSFVLIHFSIEKKKNEPLKARVEVSGHLMTEGEKLTYSMRSSILLELERNEVKQMVKTEIVVIILRRIGKC